MQDTSFWVAPIACHAFFEQAEFERLLCHDFLQVTGLFAQIFDFVSRGSAGRIASQSALPSFHEVL